MIVSHLWNMATLSSVVHLLFGTSELFVIKVLMFDVCHRCHKPCALFFGEGPHTTTRRITALISQNLLCVQVCVLPAVQQELQDWNGHFYHHNSPIHFCQMPPLISWSICWDECQTSKVNVKWIVQWDALGLRPSGSTTYKREHLIFECILDFPSPNVHDSIRHPLVQRQSSLYQ